MAGYKGSFDEIEKLGSGAFGKVYKARHSLDGQEYAVKKIRLRHGLKEDELKQARHSLDGQEYAVKKIRLRHGLKEDELKQPKNIFLQGDHLHVKIGDFGLAKEHVVEGPVIDIKHRVRAEGEN
nr:hypothetical protein BaRGS_019096 [Batillaria attramentaria]